MSDAGWYVAGAAAVLCMLAYVRFRGRTDGEAEGSLHRGPPKADDSLVDRITVDRSANRKNYSRRARTAEFTVRLMPVGVVDVPARVHENALYFSSALASGEVVYVGVTPGAEWMNIHTRKRRQGDATGHYSGDYHEYGFSRVRNNWSYGVAPAGATEIRDIIEAVVAYAERR